MKFIIHRLSIALLTAVFLFASCEDKQRSKKNEPKSKPDTVKIEEKVPEEPKLSQEEKIERKIEKDTMFPIAQEELIPKLMAYGKKNPETLVRITTSYGTIEVRLYRDTPLHRANFIMLAKNGYFRNTYFHRVAPGFVIQGGNSDNQSTANKRHDIGDYLIPSEFSSRHVHNRGAFSAAKYTEQNVSKASSPFEFFIVMDPSGAHHLDNEHTVYGEVVKGMDVAEKIEKVKTGDSEWPIKNVPLEVEVVE